MPWNSVNIVKAFKVLPKLILKGTFYAQFGCKIRPGRLTGSHLGIDSQRLLPSTSQNGPYGIYSYALILIAMLEIHAFSQ